MYIGNRSIGSGLWTEAEEAMKLFAPVVRQVEQRCLYAGQMVYPLSVGMIGNAGAVASLRVSKFLDGGVDDRRKEDGLYVDKDVPKIQSSKSASEVSLGVLRDNYGQLSWRELPTLDDINKLGIRCLLLSPPQSGGEEDLDGAHDGEIVHEQFRNML